MSIIIRIYFDILKGEGEYKLYLKDNILDKKFIKMRKSNLPKKFDDMTIEDLKVIGQNTKEKANYKSNLDLFIEYYDNLEENIINGYGLIFCGPVGVGKTLMMTLVAHKSMEIFDIENSKIVEYSRLIKNDESMLDEFKNTLYFIQATSLFDLAFSFGLTDEQKVMRTKLKQLAGLFIDDISKLQTTKNGGEIAFMDDILRHRDCNKLPVWATSQVKFENLEQIFTKPIFDLLRGNNLVLQFVGDSQR